MRQRVYIETSIPSFYYTQREDVESKARMNWTRQWWGECSGDFSLVSSAAVIAELRRGKSDMVEGRIDLLDGAQLLPITEEVEEIAQIYIDKMIMPKDPQGDALHLAVTSFYRVEVLLTWNCTHIANPNKFEKIRFVNFEIGLPVPTLTTPMNFLSGGDR
jgi:hypothetical protein